MIITKYELLSIVADMPDKIEVEEVIDRILSCAKIEPALSGSEQRLNQYRNNVKEKRLKKSDLIRKF